MKITNFIIFSILIMIIVPIFFYIFFIKMTIIDIKIIDTDVNIDYSVGFNLDTDALHFGIVPPAGTGTRNITITNEYNRDCKVNINIDGKMKDWFEISNNNFEFKENQSENIMFKINPPIDTKIGDYNSKIILTFLKI
jgi:hypothetical protein